MIKILLIALAPICFAPIGGKVIEISFVDAKPNRVMYLADQTGHHVSHVTFGGASRHKETGSLYSFFEHIAGDYSDLNVTSAGGFEPAVGNFRIAVGYWWSFTLIGGDYSDLVEQLVFNYIIINKKRYLDQSIASIAGDWPWLVMLQLNVRQGFSAVQET